MDPKKSQTNREYSNSEAKKIALAAVEKLATNNQFLIFLEGGHDDDALAGFFQSQDNQDALKNAHTRHLGVELSADKQEMVDQLMEGRINKAEFKKLFTENGDYLVERTIHEKGKVPKDAIDDFADFALRVKKSGLRIDCIDAPSGPFTLLRDGRDTYIKHLNAWKDLLGDKTIDQMKEELQIRRMKADNTDFLKTLNLGDFRPDLDKAKSAYAQLNTIGMFKDYLLAESKHDNACETMLKTLHSLNFNDKQALTGDAENDPDRTIEKKFAVERIVQNKQIAMNIEAASHGEKMSVMIGFLHSTGASGLRQLLDVNKAVEIGLVRDEDIVKAIYEDRADTNPENYHPGALPATTILLTNTTAQLLQHDGVKIGDEVSMEKENIDEYLGSFVPLKMTDLKEQNFVGAKKPQIVR